MTAILRAVVLRLAGRALSVTAFGAVLSAVLYTLAELFVTLAITAGVAIFRAVLAWAANIISAFGAVCWAGVNRLLPEQTPSPQVEQSCGQVCWFSPIQSQSPSPQREQSFGQLSLFSNGSEQT